MSKKGKNSTLSLATLGKLSKPLSFLSPIKLNDDSTESTPKKSVSKSQTHQGTVWLDIDNPSTYVLSKLAEEYPLSSQHLDDSILRQLPTVEKDDKYIFVLLYIPELEAKEDKIITSQVGVFIGKKFIITLHDESAKSVKQLFKSYEDDEQLANEHFKKSSSYLLHVFVKKAIEDLTAITQSVTQELDVIEDSVFDSDDSDAYELSRLRQKIVRTRRIATSLKNVLTEIAPGISGYTKENLARQFTKDSKVTNKLIETIDEARETVEIYKDADFTASTEKTNKILAVLTLIFTFTIPPTVIGTFYGMNILVPGGIEAGSWTHFGPFTTLIFIIALSILPIAIMYWYFKYKKWF
jgi:magnesium transporter